MSSLSLGRARYEGFARLAETSTPGGRARSPVDALIEAAQEEGELVLVMGGAAGLNYRPVAEFFGAKFGIKTVIATGSSRALGDGVLAERDAGLYLVDVMFVGPLRATLTLIPANALDPIAEQFIHPEVLDMSLWFGGKHWWADPAHQYVFTMSADPGPIIPMRFNTDLMTQADLDGINSVWDYLDPSGRARSWRSRR